MLFNSLIFTVFLPIVFTIYWITPAKYRNYFLLLASYYFYYSYNPYFLLLLIGTSILDYWCAKKIHQTQYKKHFLILSLISNLGTLIAFKYFVFLYNSIVGGFNLSSNLFNQIIVPAGLSFYTFQSISYTIDVYRGKYPPKDNLQDFLLYVSFFPHMVAGPIVRYNDLMPQLKLKTFFSNINWESSIKLIIWGYFKKLVVADNLNHFVTPVFNNIINFNSFEIILASIGFVIQVYADFSGYSDIAIGVAKLFNINLSINWRRPLFSLSLHDFWKRNHISITNWFRDYLYIGLGGNRKGKLRWLLNIFLVFIISAMWHGANFTFLIWGLWHAIFFILEILYLEKYKLFNAPKILGWFYLIIIHTISLIAFRANSVTDIIFIYKSILFNSNTLEIANILKINDISLYVVILFSILILLLKDLQDEYNFIKENKIKHIFLSPMFYMLVVFLIFIIGDFNANAFIYFQF